MANEDGWIKSDDSVLIGSIEKYEGDKDVVYSYMKSGRLKASEGCGVEACSEEKASVSSLHNSLK